MSQINFTTIIIEKFDIFTFDSTKSSNKFEIFKTLSYINLKNSRKNEVYRVKKIFLVKENFL